MGDALAKDIRELQAGPSPRGSMSTGIVIGLLELWGRLLDHGEALRGAAKPISAPVYSERVSASTVLLVGGRKRRSNRR